MLHEQPWFWPLVALVLAAGLVTDAMRRRKKHKPDDEV